MGHHLDTYIESQDDLKSKSTAADQSGSSKGQRDVRSLKYNPDTAFPSAYTADGGPGGLQTAGSELKYPNYHQPTQPRLHPCAAPLGVPLINKTSS